MKKYKYILMISPIILILDIITKTWAVNRLKGQENITIIENYFHFIYRENPGAAWSFLADIPDSVRNPIFIAAILIAVTVVFFMYKNLKDNQIVLKIAFASVIGGATGNLYDRLFRGATLFNGNVVDFIDWHNKDIYHWPTFNIADMGLVLAMFLIGYEVLIGERFRKKKELELNEEAPNEA